MQSASASPASLCHQSSFCGVFFPSLLFVYSTFYFCLICCLSVLASLWRFSAKHSSMLFTSVFILYLFFFWSSLSLTVPLRAKKRKRPLNKARPMPLWQNKKKKVPMYISSSAGKYFVKNTNILVRPHFS